jgi:hypothetical protein
MTLFAEARSFHFHNGSTGPSSPSSVTSPGVSSRYDWTARYAGQVQNASSWTLMKSSPIAARMPPSKQRGVASYDECGQPPVPVVHPRSSIRSAARFRTSLVGIAVSVMSAPSVLLSGLSVAGEPTPRGGQWPRGVGALGLPPSVSRGLPCLVAATPAFLWMFRPGARCLPLRTRVGKL